VVLFAMTLLAVVVLFAMTVLSVVVLLAGVVVLDTTLFAFEFLLGSSGGPHAATEIAVRARASLMPDFIYSPWVALTAARTAKVGFAFSHFDGQDC
jgi:hypothetical protein